MVKKELTKILNWNIPFLSTSKNIIKSVEELHKENKLGSIYEYSKGAAKSTTRGLLIGVIGVLIGGGGFQLATIAGLGTCIIDASAYGFRYLGTSGIKRKSEERYQLFLQEFHNPDFTRKSPKLII